MHVAVLGAYGSAGVAAADHLVEALDGPVSTVSLIDPGPAGGLCILRGCMPSKAVLHPAATAHDAQTDPRVNGTTTIDTDTVVDYKDEHINSFADHRKSQVETLAQNDNVELYESEAHFVDETTIVVGETELSPDYTVVATGSTPSIPPVDGLEEVDFLTSDDILDMKTFPDSALIVGFGAVGTEMAPYLSANGVDVTVLDRGSRPLRAASPIISDELRSVYTGAFDVDIVTEASVTGFGETADGGIRAHTGTGAVYEAESLCLFTGRKPAVDSIQLGNADVAPSDGWVDEQLRVVGTDSLFAAGDVTGTHQILHMAKEEGAIAAQNILATHGNEELTAYDPTPHQVLFTGLGKYPYANVGLTAQQGRSDDCIVVERQASDDGIFALKHADEGVAALVVDDDGTVVGYEGFHYHADVMAKTAQVLVEGEMHITDIPDRAYHPTTPEILDGLLREAQAQYAEQSQG